MEQSLEWRNDFEEVLRLVVEEARAYLAHVDTLPARHQNAYADTKAIPGVMPIKGSGAAETLRELIDLSRTTTVTTSGPRCFHFVIGGSTPAALGGDWLASLYDQLAYAWVSSPLAVQLEIISLRWMAEMFGIPADWKSIMTTGATMSNFVGLAAGRQWVGEQLGVDVAEEGLSGLPPIPVLTSGHIHASTLKALAMLGIGRRRVERITADNTGRLDLQDLEARLQALGGQPAILIGTAGEPNAGAFDPIARLADLAAQYNCWLHVDGAFGLFAGLSARTAHLVAGMEGAHSITVDGHKWLNVPYDCGFAFVCDETLLIKAFRYTAEYLPGPDDPEPVMGTIGPESSRRARSFSVWSTLKAYGVEGYRRLIERHLDLAQYLKSRVEEEEQLELLADVQLNVVCFRFKPAEYNDEQLNRTNKVLGERILADGRVYVGTTTYDGKVALRPAISNWRTEREDVDLLVKVVLELGQEVHLEMPTDKE